MKRAARSGIAVMLAAVAFGPRGAIAAQAPADSVRQPFTPADVRWMTGMIHHHAQAILIAGWAPSHGASPGMQTLCARIVVSQRDEIALMRRWLSDRHQPLPDTSSSHVMMPEMDAATMMPGMLTGAQLAQLDSARGADFDRLFLTFMIRHHQGAITMVNELFAQGAGENTSVYRLATGIFADQTTEIARMQKMLAALTLDTSGQ